MKKVTAITFCIYLLATCVSSQTVTWKNVSTALIDTLAKQGRTQTDTPCWTGSSGVAVNHSNGDVYIRLIDLGVFKSSDEGQTWTELPTNGTVNSRDVGGLSINMDQNNPSRMAVFSIWGISGYTVGGAWQMMAQTSSGFDLGSFDWSSTNPKVVMACEHESNGAVVLSIDGCNTWKTMNITVDAQNNPTTSMIGAIDSTTLIYSNGSGMYRSTDTGLTWTKVAGFNSQTKYPIFFNGAYYLGTSNGLIKSIDKGATWQYLGSPISVVEGPFFGAGETDSTMVVVTTAALFRTDNEGTTWTQICPIISAGGGLPQCSYGYGPTWFGGYAWDPVNNIVYANGANTPTVQAKLGSSSATQKISAHSKSNMAAEKRSLTITDGHVILSKSLSSGTNVDLFDISGRFIGRSSTVVDRIAKIYKK